MGIALGAALACWFGSSGVVHAPAVSADTLAAGAARGPREQRSVGAELSGTDGARLGWSTVDRATLHPDRLPARNAARAPPEDAVLVRLANDIGTWRSGDRVTLPIPQTGAILAAVIDRDGSAAGGNRQYVGWLTDAGRPYRVIVTVGTRNVFAFVGTAAGAYELAGNTEFGWLAPSASLDGHVDYSRPDYLLPGETEPRGR